MIQLKFMRKLSKSLDNKASVITIPRAIAQLWEQYDLVELIFDGSSLVIAPIDNIERIQRDDCE
jgi:hypothetical protein